VTESLAVAWGPLVADGAPFAAASTPATLTVQPARLDDPIWWLNRLFAALAKKQRALQIFEDYYCGDHPLPWLPAQARSEFRRILKMTRTNYMGLVIDSMVERMNVEGFRVGADADKKLWQIWQYNNLDSSSDQAFLEAGKSGSAYAMVGPNPDRPEMPIISIEHPSQAIVEHVPGNRRKRAAGMKVWVDEWTGRIEAELQVPKFVVRAWAKAPTGGLPRWTITGIEPNPAEEVTIVELPNNPRLMLGGVSELADLLDPQDRINKTVADRLITQDFGAFPQKWASGYPEEDDQGNPTPGIDIGRNRLVTTDVVEAKFGQWDAAPLDPYSMAKREDVKDIASRSRTPAQYLLGEMSNVNGETLKASESGLISKVRQRMRGHDGPLEDVMNIAARLGGLTSESYIAMETIWRSPEYRTEGEVTDAAIKRLNSGIASLRQSREDVGYTQTQIERMEDEDAERDAAVFERISRPVVTPAPTDGAPADEL